MRSNLWAFLTGFAIAIVGWLAVVVMQVANLALLAALVVVGLLAALAGRRWMALSGVVIGMLVYPVTIALASPNVLGESWVFYAATFAGLTASGFAGGRALIWLREARA